MEEEQVLYQNKIDTHDYKLFGIFNSLLIASLVLCDVFVFKVVSLFGLSLALSGCIFPLTSLLMICINEIYGHKKASFALINLITAQIIVLIGLNFLPHLSSPANYAPNIANAYLVIFKNEWRVFVSSPVGISVSLYLSSIINSKLKTFFWGKYLVFRATVTSIISIAVLVLIIYPINFAFILTWREILKVCVDTYFYKIVMAFVVIIISYPIIRLSKRIEKIDVFDIGIKYSPSYIYSSQSIGVNMYESTSNN